MLRLVLLLALLIPQIRPPSTLRAPATPPSEGTGKFREHTYTFKQETFYYVLEYTPLLPGKRPVVLEAMRGACHDLYDLDFSKATPRPGPGPDEWLFELKDLRICYAKQMPATGPAGEIKTLRVWMPA
jgi:hypothetical protein